MHLVACQTPHLLFCCSFSDWPPNESPARLKMLTSVAVPSVTMLVMDASMRAFFLSVVRSWIQGPSVISSWCDIFHCPCRCLVARMQSESCYNLVWLSHTSICGMDTFRCKVFRLRHMLLSLGIPQIISCHQQSCRLLMLFWRCWLIGNVGIW